MGRAKKVPKKATPKQTMPKKAVPKKGVPKQAVPMQTAPKQTTLKQTTPKQKQALEQPTAFDPLDYMTEQELNDVDAQLASALAGVDTVLFWTGVDWAHAQKWAKVWDIKTLTMAMGPLMDPKNPSSPKALRGGKSYSRYVKGASGRFAEYARQHCRVIVLTNPPPCIYSSRENNTYQRLEEPILKGHFGGAPVRRIDYLHPNVDGAAHITYQVWPLDKTQDWASSFGRSSVKKWKGLEWNYRSLLTTSQFKLPLEVQDKVNARHSTQLTDRVDHVDDDLATAPDIKGHESRNLDPQPIPGASVCDDHERSETQVHSQVEPGVDFHDLGPLDESNCPQPPGYVVERCSTPGLPLTVPVVSVNELAPGDEVTIVVSELGSEKEFMYLTMDVGAELRFWRLKWE